MGRSPSSLNASQQEHLQAQAKQLGLEPLELLRQAVLSGTFLTGVLREGEIKTFSEDRHLRRKRLP